jgi:hypothetical protein
MASAPPEKAAAELRAGRRDRIVIHGHRRASVSRPSEARAGIAKK